MYHPSLRSEIGISASLSAWLEGGLKKLLDELRAQVAEDNVARLECGIRCYCRWNRETKEPVVHFGVEYKYYREGSDDRDAAQAFALVHKVVRCLEASGATTAISGVQDTAAPAEG